MDLIIEILTAWRDADEATRQEVLAYLRAVAANRLN